MSKKIKMFKKFSLAVSYIAVITSQASFAADVQPVPQEQKQLEVIDTVAGSENDKVNDVMPVEIISEPAKTAPSADGATTKDVKDATTPSVSEAPSVSDPDDVPDNDPVPQSNTVIPEEEEFRQLLIDADKPLVVDGATSEGTAVESPEKEEGVPPQKDPLASDNNPASPQNTDSPSTNNDTVQPNTDAIGLKNNNLDAEPSLDTKTSQTLDPYLDLRNHLSNFLLSFAGEEQLSKSNPHLKNIEADDTQNVTTTEDVTATEGTAPTERAAATEGTSTTEADNNTSTTATDSDDTNNKALDEVFDDKIDIEEDSSQKNLAEEKLKKEKEEKKELIMGDCDELPSKIATCEEFSCKMPNPVGGKDTVVISLEKDGDICNYTSTSSEKSEFNCMLNKSEISILSELTKSYFAASADKNLNVESEFSTQCKPTELAESTEVKVDEKTKPAKLELDEEDSAYFEALDKEKKSLPESKQLPNSVTKTINDVAPTLADKKKPSSKKEKSEKYKISHGDKPKKSNDEDGVKKSDNGMDISMSVSSSEQSEIRVSIDKAYRALVSGQTSAAISLYNKVLDIDDKNMDALFGLATAYHRNYQYEQARSIYAKILTINPNNKEVLNNFLVLVAEESPESALIELQKLERINTTFSPIPAQIAMIYLKMGQTEKAERYLRRAITLSPENITYKYNLAITSDKLNKHSQAIILYKQVLDAARMGVTIPGSANAIQERMNYLEGKLSSIN